MVDVRPRTATRVRPSVAHRAVPDRPAPPLRRRDSNKLTAAPTCHLLRHSWLLDLELVGEGPSPRDAHAAAVHGQWMYVFGGYDSKRYLNDFHRFHFDTNTWSPVSHAGGGPSPRGGHTAVVYQYTMFVFGGCDGWNYFNDCYRFDFNSSEWTAVRVTGTAPGARSAPATVIHESHGTVRCAPLVRHVPLGTRVCAERTLRVVRGRPCVHCAEDTAPRGARGVTVPQRQHCGRRRTPVVLGRCFLLTRRTRGAAATDASPPVGFRCTSSAATTARAL